MRFEFIDETLTVQTIDAGASVYKPTRKPWTEYATADMGSAREITHLGEEISINIQIPYFTDVELPLFEAMCDSLERNRTMDISNPDSAIILMADKFPLVARRQENSIPQPEHINTSCNNKFRLSLDLIITG